MLDVVMMNFHQLSIITIMLLLQKEVAFAQDCYRPEIPANGTIAPSSFTYSSGSIVKYTCNSGFALSEGNTTVACRNSKWIGTTPLCIADGVKRGCGNPPQALFTKLTAIPANKKPGDEIQQECAVSYGPEVRAKCRCLDTGRWDEMCSSSIICKKIPGPPVNVTISALSSSCYALNWKPFKNSFTGTILYQYRCNDNRKWRTMSGNSNGFSSCGHYPYEVYQCEVRALNGMVPSEVRPSRSIRTLCAEPSAPQNLKFSSPTQVTKSGRKQWKYVVSWQAPKDINCARLHQYAYDIVYPTPTSGKTSVQSTSMVVYSDENTKISFTVTARNSASFTSPSTTVTMTTPVLDIPGSPKYLKVTPYDSNCIIIKWDKVHDITGIQFRCNHFGNWTMVRSPNQTTISKCEYTPYQLVTCEIRSVKGAAVSNVTNSPPVRTNCSVPSAPRDLMVGPPYYTSHEGQMMWKYVITWKAPKDINCDRLDQRYPYVHSTRDSTRRNSTMFSSVAASTVIYLASNAQTNFSVWARNKKGESTSFTSVLITSPKQDKDGGSADSDKCPLKDYIAVTNQGTGNGDFYVHLPDGNYYRLSLPVGTYSYEFVAPTGNNCSSLIKIRDYKSTAMRRMEFEARYSIDCSLLTEGSTKQFVETTTTQNIKLIQVLCGDACNVTVHDDMQKYINCQNDTLTMRWPTDAIYQADMKRAALLDQMTTKLIQKGTFLPVVIITKVPPILYPIVNNDGSSARVILMPTCLNKRTYNQQSDTCE